ncbi:MAG TPA: 4a-hydroxytetrahydrobiopterin dehydratase [Ideonella sp.]|uniref:4a-hydroxytetrahydrobiopterin dehydratase n=1 Tax=Ideonella sp. TaxID=1929293 RepID=UPI002D09F320|nr:4a-hydroxytetrahydrobiopterin dehydratase [Ideonella sp.]HSI46943.1 4a-hydroxytetrahydrobiopterin dehydratase [Ideonella sp.]
MSAAAPKTVRPSALTSAQLHAALAQLPGWEVVHTPATSAESPATRELFRSYRFAAFEDAMAFMAAAVPFISAQDHHPRWENSWRSVSVWLCTHDAGHQPTQLDITLAEHLDSLRQGFAPARN